MAGLDVTIKRDPLALRRWSVKAGSIPGEIKRATRDALTEELQESIVYMQRTYLSGLATTRTRLARRSGALHDSFLQRVTMRPDGVDARLYQSRQATGALGARPAIYGPVHETGAVIVPKRAQWLKIPLTDAARARPNAQGKLFFFRSRAGNSFLARRLGRGLLELVFLLRKSVRIPARPFFSFTVDRLERRLGPALRRAYRSVAAKLGRRR
jgi:hypothetical protein